MTLGNLALTGSSIFTALASPAFAPWLISGSKRIEPIAPPDCARARRPLRRGTAAAGVLRGRVTFGHASVMDASWVPESCQPRRTCGVSRPRQRYARWPRS